MSQQPDLISKEPPMQIVTQSTEEFYEACARGKRGEIVIEAIELGRTNGEWIFKLRKQNEL